MNDLNHIYNQDCLTGLRALPDGCVDLVVMDPPYVIGNKGGGFWSKAEEGNHYIGYEINADYCKTADERIKIYKQERL